MNLTIGNDGVDFHGKRAVHGADALNDTDLVTLRQLRKRLQLFTGTTLININTVGNGYPVFSGYSQNTYWFRSFSSVTPYLLMHTGDTITFEVDVAAINSATAFTWEHLWCASTGNQAIIRNNYTNNVAAGNFSIVAAVQSTAPGHYSWVAGGSGHTVNNDFSFIGGGLVNSTSGITNFIGSGSHQVTDGPYSSIVNGFGNRAIRGFSFIGNGLGNYSVGNFGFIGNGAFNSGYSAYTTVINGANILNQGIFNIVGNGTNHKITGNTG